MNIAILGAGPAGCAAAYFLSKKGIKDITIYERAELGGCAHTRFYKGIPYEFGPQIMFTNKEYLKKIFKKFLKYYPPPNKEKTFRYVLSVDGTLKKLHDFPITFRNVLLFEHPESVISELYNVNLDTPNMKNLEEYCISRIGKTLYKTYVQNYNKKVWKTKPSEMSTDWAGFRPLTVQKSTSRFGKQWQGHPGNYNPMWEKMTSRVNVKYAEIALEDDFTYSVNGRPLKAEVIISTIPISKRLDYVNMLMVYAGLKSIKPVMPCAFTTFPNTYNFTRIFEYKQQFSVTSGYTLISFDFPWRKRINKRQCIDQAKGFCGKILKKKVKDTLTVNRTNIYPLNTKKNNRIFVKLLKESRSTNVIPIGRAGMYGYISKDTAIRMGLEVARYLDELTDSKSKVSRLLKIREDLH